MPSFNIFCISLIKHINNLIKIKIQIKFRFSVLLDVYKSNNKRNTNQYFLRNSIQIYAKFNICNITI